MGNKFSGCQSKKGAAAPGLAPAAQPGPTPAGAGEETGAGQKPNLLTDEVQGTPKTADTAKTEAGTPSVAEGAAAGSPKQAATMPKTEAEEAQQQAGADEADGPAAKESQAKDVEVRDAQDEQAGGQETEAKETEDKQTGDKQLPEPTTEAAGEEATTQKEEPAASQSTPDQIAVESAQEPSAKDEPGLVSTQAQINPHPQVARKQKNDGCGAWACDP